MIEETYISSLTLGEGFNEAWVRVIKDPRALDYKAQNIVFGMWSLFPSKVVKSHLSKNKTVFLISLCGKDMVD